MRTLLFLLEEPSAKDLLTGLLPRLLRPETQTEFLVFDGKQDLEANIERKIRGWQRTDTRYVVLRDQDASDCRALKKHLVSLVPPDHRALTVVRIACRELESWFLGDWQAVGAAFGEPKLAANQRKRPYRNPDDLKNPILELRKHLPRFQKRDGARRMGPLLNIEKNESRSFHAFCEAVRRLAE